MDVAANAKP